MKKTNIFTAIKISVSLLVLSLMSGMNFACDTCPPGWINGGSTCYKGDGCPSWVCKEYWDPDANCASVRVYYNATCYKSVYKCRYYTGTCSTLTCDGMYCWTKYYSCRKSICYYDSVPFTCEKSRIDIVCGGETVYENCTGECLLCPAPPPPPPPPACQTNSTYNLNVYVKNAESGCGSLGSAESGTSVTVYKDASGNLGEVLFTGETDASGKVSKTAISISNSTLYFQASKVVGGEEPATYYLNCPTPSIYKEVLNPSACDTKTINLGVIPVDAISWKTVIDGDIFASGINIEIPETTPLGGFSSFLINSDGGAGGYAFVKDALISLISKIAESQGGFAEALEDGGIIHNDVALQKFTFLPPDHPEVVNTSNLNSFENGKVYTISVSDFNSSLSSAPVTYSLSSGMAVLYIVGSDDVVVQNSLTSLGSGRLIIVTDAYVYVSKNVGYTGSVGFDITSNPNIEAAILTSKDITFESEGTNPGTDNPIMVLGPLVSAQIIHLGRDLGVLNARYPAIAVAHDQSLMCKIGKVEKDHQDYTNYTGLRTFDIQFDYGN
ncbi:hypothetical protein KKG08_00875 [Patescibacteria group bacterium]|nr:hypothetical protein [Patescibacteria group bacterium]